MSKRIKCFVRIIALVLVFALCAPMNAKAAAPETIMPMASDYLVTYDAYICAMGDGKLNIYFEVLGTGTWADIGVLSIYLYESTDNADFYWIKTFQHMDYEQMLASNDWYHASYVEYDGVPGRYYKAYVCIWAGPVDGGDARYIWTEVEPCV